MERLQEKTEKCYELNKNHEIHETHENGGKTGR
jgi:hypothetical protein